MTNIHYFEGYYGRHKDKKKRVAQNNVAQNREKVLRCRIDNKTYERFLERCEVKNLDKSKLLREMIVYCLDKVDEIAWQKEVENWE